MRGRLLLLSLALVALSLTACGDEVTAIPAISSSTGLSAPSVIPTFTPPPVEPGTPTPTLIVVPATATPAPTFTAALAPTPTPPPTATPPPRPTLIPTATAAPDQFRVITPEQARNLNGYRTLLPAGFKLLYIKASQSETPRMITVIGAYFDENRHYFYLNVQAFPSGEFPAVTPVNANLEPVLQTTQDALFQQESVLVRGQAALLTYTGQIASLGWSEGYSRYLINGMLPRDEILKVAASLQ